MYYKKGHLHVKHERWKRSEAKMVYITEMRSVL